MPQERTVLFDQPTETYIASNTKGTYGTLTRVRGIVTMNLTIRQQSAELRADGIVYATVGRVLGGSGSMQIADLQDFQIMNDLLGANATSSGDAFMMSITGNQNLPYFAFLSKVPTDEAPKEMHFFASRAKITSEPQISLSEGQFSLPQFDFTIEPDPFITLDDDELVMSWLRYAAKTSAAIPPVGLNLVQVT